MEQRTAIKFCVKLQKSFTEMFAMIRTAYGDDALSRTTLHTQLKRFKEGKDSIENDKTCEDNVDCFLRLKKPHTP